MSESGSPLSTRVSKLRDLPVPQHPAVSTWRSATAADIDAIWNLEQAIGRADHPNYGVRRDDVADTFTASYIDVATDTLVGLDANGDIIAYGLVALQPGQQTLVKCTLDGGVLPSMRARGIGRELLHWQIARATQHLAASEAQLPGWIVASCDDRAPRSGRLYERAGLGRTRYFLTLERLLTDPIRDIALGAGIRVTEYTPELSAAVHAARDAAFMDHWSSQPETPETWNAYVTASSFTNALSFVALAALPDGTEEVVGFALSNVNEEDWVAAGYRSSYISLVGVLSKWRGQHIAQALLAAQLIAGRAAGYERSTLDVDSASPTGALDLYTGMGFFETNRETAYVRTF